MMILGCGVGGIVDNLKDVLLLYYYYLFCCGLVAVKVVDLQ